MNLIKELLSTAGSLGNITYVGGATGAGSGGNLTVDISSIDVQSGDLIVYVAARGSHTTDFDPTLTGYTKFSTLYSSSSDRNCNTGSGYKIADGTETSVGAFSGSATYVPSAVVKVFRGVDQTTPFDVTRTTNLQGSTVDTNPPSNTPASREAMALVIGGTYHTAGAAQYYTSPDLDEFQSIAGDGTYDACTSFGIKQLSDFSAFDPATWTFTSGSNADTNTGSATMIIRPA